MTPLVLVRKDSYFDSILLLRVSQALKGTPGIEDAVVVMGTPQNRALLQAIGYGGAELETAGPNDLVLGIKGEGVSPRRILEALDAIVRAEAPSPSASRGPATLAVAVAEHSEAGLVLISVPGEHAAREARRALALGRHVMIFSDNVPLEDEVALKAEAVRQGLLLMGPDCGTAMINGKSCMVVQYMVGVAPAKMWLWQDYGLPIRVEATTTQGMTLMEYKNIQFGDIADSVFELPEGVQIIQQPGT